jgi:alkylation response protein AidB-like acyl-CoA dehydrogenase
VAETTGFRRSEEQKMLADTLREVLDSVSDTDATRTLSLEVDAIDRPTWKALSEMGVIGLTLPAAHGGADSPMTDLAVVFEELGRAVRAVPLVSTVAAATAIVEAGDDAQRAAFVPSLASGEVVGTLAVFEDAHGGGVDDPATIAVRRDGGIRLTGTKRYVTDAMHAGIFVVSASIDGGVGLFVVAAGTEGVTVESLNALDPTRPLGHVTLDVVVGDDAYLGGAPNRDALARALDVAVVAIAAEQVGAAERCLEMSVEYARSRYQFGRAIGSFQAIKHRCADMLVALEHARTVAWHAAATIDDPVEAAISVPLAKSVCSDAAMRAAGDTIQIHGGIGFTWEHDAHLYFKRAKATSLLFGSIDHHRDRLADALGI